MASRIDSRGCRDICRTVYSPVTDAAKGMALNLKLQVNQQIADLVLLASWNPDPEIKRHLAIAMTSFEDAALYAAKAILSEGFLCANPSPDGPAPNQRTPQDTPQGQQTESS